MDTLPADILKLVLARLAPHVRAGARAVCRALCAAADDKAMWPDHEIKRMGRLCKRRILALAETGNLASLQWALGTLPLKSAAVCAWATFEVACAHGHLETAQWLATALGIKALHVREWGGMVAAVNGHTPVVAWLSETYGPDLGDKTRKQSLG